VGGGAATSGLELHAVHGFGVYERNVAKRDEAAERLVAGAAPVAAVAAENVTAGSDHGLGQVVNRGLVAVAQRELAGDAPVAERRAGAFALHAGLIFAAIALVVAGLARLGVRVTGGLALALCSRLRAVHKMREHARRRAA
jgi:hypothetical protein